jgi:vancomycin aglycone glucosyltransferase
MHVLLSTIGSRGDVQPVLALALRLRVLGQQVRLVAPPDFRELIDGCGLPCLPIGPELRKAAGAARPSPGSPPSPEVLRQMATAMVVDQFATVGQAAEGCNVIVGGGALQVATRSVAEQKGIPYIFAAYCPITLPSAHHAPPPLPIRGQTPTPAAADNRTLWDQDVQFWNDT